MQNLLNTLNTLSILLAKRSDAFFAFAVVGIVFMMILPLPTGLVDVLIALNISISALLVVMALYLPGPLAFSTFPALLLITTLFRMALSITTTRLILLQGDAGNIVEAFGNFVVGGNLVVGVVIFLILLVVNFLVITKGSERVAEVSARFTLDAMPGKQMSIDSDLRAGLLDASQAMQKRKDLAKESQLFGAMDGAMKFVKGDAIAGIIIVMVNIIGGFSIGVAQLGLPSGEAIKIYSILTIGDGLISQIPALLIALTSGMIITRVKDDVMDDLNVGQEMVQQLVSEPKAWLIASIVLVGFALVPGMPSTAFIMLSFIFAFIGGSKILLAMQIEKEKVEKDNKEQKQIQPEVRDDVEVNTFSVYERATISVHPSVLTQSYFQELERRLRVVRNEIVLKYGYILPSFKAMSDKSLKEDEFVMRFYEIPVVQATFRQDKIAVRVSDQETLTQHALNFEQGLEKKQEEGFLWLSIEDKVKLEELKIKTFDPTDLICQRTNIEIFKACDQFIGLEESHKVMEWATSNIPQLAKEFERVMSISKLAHILRSLAGEKISLRSLRRIFETVVANAPNERDIDALIEIVRISLREQICTAFAQDNNIDVCLLEPHVEEMLRESLRKTATGGYFALDQEASDRILANVKESTQSHINNQKPIALVVAQDIRKYLRDMIKADIFELPVLSYSELSPKIGVTPICRIDT